MRKVSFTGGGKVSGAIMRDAAVSMKSVQFERGGNDPVIVLDHVDIERAVTRIAAGAFLRAGQFCFAVKRVYLPESMYDCFLAQHHGADEQPSSVELREGPGGTCACRGRRRDRTRRVAGPAGCAGGYFLRPALVRRAAPQSEIVAVEQFGLVLPVIAYQDEAQAVQMANDSELGLGSSVWSRSRARALGIAQQLEAGMTFINEAGTSRVGQRHGPFGGVKQSGIGRESSEVGMAE